MTIKNETFKTKGQLSAHDKQGNPVILEWQKTTLFAPEFAAAMKEVWECGRDAYLPVEMKFLRAYPQVVGTEEYYKPFEPFFKNGLHAVEWDKVEEVMQEILKSHFIYDTSTWGPEVLEMFGKDTCYVVTVKNQKTNTLLGFITFLERQNYKAGDSKIMSFAVAPEYQNYGLGKLLISSIFKIKKDINRIFACTRVTNKTVRLGYSLCGFTKDEHPVLDHAFNLEHWVFVEYKTDHVNTLQEIANSMILIN
jgi:GNAT superfamily N-acetyltransferase